jgi:hypothetical protein
VPTTDANFCTPELCLGYTQNKRENHRSGANSGPAGEHPMVKSIDYSQRDIMEECFERDLKESLLGWNAIHLFVFLTFLMSDSFLGGPQ